MNDHNYKQILTPDFSRIINIVLEAKGVDRTMAQFAEVTGLNTSMLSRLITGKMKRPLSADKIKIIMQHKCRSCEFSEEDLFRANGMISEETSERLYRNDHQYDRTHLQHERLTGMRAILLNELFNRGISYRKTTGAEMEKDTVLSEYSSTKSRILLKVPDSNHETYWCLALNAARLDPADIDNEQADYYMKAISDRLLSYYALYFLKDAWEPSVIKGIRFSFVFCDEILYDSFRKGLNNARIHSNMTTILVSLSEGKVLKEEPVPGCENPDQDYYFDNDVEEDTEPTDIDFLLNDIEE